MAAATTTTTTTTKYTPAAAAASIEELHSDLLARALCRMDGPTLAAASCSSSLFHSLSADPSLWRDLCLSTWPSLRLLPIFPLLPPRSFFADSFPFPDTEPSSIPVVQASKDDGSSTTTRLSGSSRKLPESLYSCVDICHAGAAVFTRVVETDTSCMLFLDSLFRIDALDRKDPPELPVPATSPAAISPAALELSWVVVGAGTGRPVNLSSRRPVAVDRHWYTGEALVRFATVLDRCAVSIVVTCGKETGQVREVVMTVEDGDGVAVNGRESLGILAAAMEGKRRERGKGEAAAKRKYEEYLRWKWMTKERTARREGMLDFCCAGFGVTVFLAFLMLIAFR